MWRSRGRELKCEALESFRGQKNVHELNVRRSRFETSKRSRPERIREAAARSIDLLEIDAALRICESTTFKTDEKRNKKEV